MSVAMQQVVHHTCAGQPGIENQSLANIPPRVRAFPKSVSHK